MKNSQTNLPFNTLLTTIADTLLQWAKDKSVQEEFPTLEKEIIDLEKSLDDKNTLEFEQAAVNLYSRLHAVSEGYSDTESNLLRKKKAYSSFAGGFSPLINAQPFIQTASISADLGAGIGIQGLLLQILYPHRKTIQIELSAEMIRLGKILQKAAGIDDERIQWINDDIANVSLKQMDFIYLYRPAKPAKEGKMLYQTIAKQLSDIDKEQIIFSVADCLGTFLDDRFSVFYSDGHLTCFRKNQSRI